jgi:hypothetical protein
MMPKKNEDQELDAPVGADDELDELSEELSDEEEDINPSKRVSLGDLDHSDLFADFDPDEEEDIEQELGRQSIRLDDPPMIGGRGMGSSMFGQRASTVGGRATSPRLYAQASNFPNCTQLRVWKWENGVPVGLGAIDSMATEEDLIYEFFDAMPKKGERKCQFKMRPIDINGNELGTEFTAIISEHHAALQKFRRMKEEEENDGRGRRRSRWDDDDSDDDIPSFIQPQFDRVMSTTEKRMELLEKQLEAERAELRRREELRMQEQVDLATSAAQGVQVLTERMMQDEAKRAERAMTMQTEQSQTLITTLTSIFAQQQTMLNAQMEQQRRQDEYRLEQERQRAAREREEERARRERERLELEERRLREREEYERKMRDERDAIERKIQQEQKRVEMRLQREREEMQLRMLREKEEREARERWFAEERLRREAQERQDALQREQDRTRQHERMMRELEMQQQKDREHAERMMILSKQELQTKAMGGLGEMLPMATGLLERFGLEPMDVVQKVFAPEKEETSPWADTLPKLLGAGADIARVALTGKAPAVSPIQAGPQALPAYEPMDDFEIDYEQQLQAMRQSQPAPQPIGRRTAVPPKTDNNVISFRDTNLPQTGQDEAVQPAPVASAQPVQPSAKEDTTTLAARAGMTLSEQRDARNGMTQLVATLHGSDQSEWEGHITSGLMTEPSIFTYIQAVSVRDAIRETGADNTLTENIVQALQNSPLVPNDINFGV